MIRAGVVTQRDPKTLKVRVNFPDLKLESYWLPVVVAKAQNDKVYALPDIGEQVICAFLAEGIEQGFCLGAIYSSVDTPPVNSGDKYHVSFQDGTTIEYDRATHTLVANVIGPVSIQSTQTIQITANQPISVQSSEHVSVEAPTVDISGNTTIHSDTGACSIRSSQPIAITAPQINITGQLNLVGNQNISGNQEVAGNVHASGTIMDANGNTNHHTH